MRQGRLRRSGVWAKVCAAFGILVALLVCARTARAEVIELAETATEPGVVIVPAEGPGPHRVRVVLHGMCGSPTNICRYFAGDFSKDEHLICPRASARCDGGGSSWPQVGFSEQIEKAVARAELALGDAVDESHGRTLVGYSLGAYRALELAHHAAGKYPRVMLIGAKIAANQKLLRENGVTRLLLSAGAFDMTHDQMRRESQRLAKGGMTARFLDLGQVGHQFTPGIREYLAQALSWLDEE
jgi:predicted esterase